MARRLTPGRAPARAGGPRRGRGARDPGTRGAARAHRGRRARGLGGVPRARRRRGRGPADRATSPRPRAGPAAGARRSSSRSPGSWSSAGSQLLAAATGRPEIGFPAALVRAGALVFGGGHVVLPLLDAGVVGPGWVTPDAFLAGYGAAQALPGPLFSFGAYLGAVSSAGPGGARGRRRRDGRDLPAGHAARPRRAAGAPPPAAPAGDRRRPRRDQRRRGRAPGGRARDARRDGRADVAPGRGPRGRRGGGAAQRSGCRRSSSSRAARSRWPGSPPPGVAVT